ncbi:MAG: hypothetical protein LBG96_16095 [Tannerella sp.]|nr:hypothetical protein [Tannerella sp.]
MTCRSSDSYPFVVRVGSPCYCCFANIRKRRLYSYRQVAMPYCGFAHIRKRRLNSYRQVAMLLRFCSYTQVASLLIPSFSVQTCEERACEWRNLTLQVFGKALAFEARDSSRLRSAPLGIDGY